MVGTAVRHAEAAQGHRLRDQIVEKGGVAVGRVATALGEACRRGKEAMAVGALVLVPNHDLTHAHTQADTQTAAAAGAVSSAGGAVSI